MNSLKKYLGWTV